jgi:hypothetical protein
VVVASMPTVLCYYGVYARGAAIPFPFGETADEVFYPALFIEYRACILIEFNRR